MDERGTQEHSNANFHNNYFHYDYCYYYHCLLLTFFLGHPVGNLLSYLITCLDYALIQKLDFNNDGFARKESIKPALVTDL